MYTYMACVVNNFFGLPFINSAGNALLTIATGELSEVQAERTGLVPTHAYAILNVLEVKVSI